MPQEHDGVQGQVDLLPFPEERGHSAEVLENLAHDQAKDVPFGHRERLVGCQELRKPEVAGRVRLLLDEMLPQEDQAIQLVAAHQVLERDGQARRGDNVGFLQSHHGVLGADFLGQLRDTCVFRGNSSRRPIRCLMSRSMMCGPSFPVTAVLSNWKSYMPRNTCPISAMFQCLRFRMVVQTSMKRKISVVGRVLIVAAHDGGESRVRSHLAKPRGELDDPHRARVAQGLVVGGGEVQPRVDLAGEQAQGQIRGKVQEALVDDVVRAIGALADHQDVDGLLLEEPARLVRQVQGIHHAG